MKTIETCDLSKVTGGTLSGKLIGGAAGTLITTGLASAVCGPAAPGCFAVAAGAGLFAGAVAGDRNM